MKGAAELIQQVESFGVTLRADGCHLVLKPSGKIPPELRERLRERKPEVLAYLSRPGIPDPHDSWEWVEERACIMEADGGLSRDEANHRAFLQWFERFIGRIEVIQ